MKIFTERVVSLPTDCALTVGKFESVHKGHQFLIAETVRLAKQNGIPSAVMTFEPNPVKALSDADYRPVFTTAERRLIFERLGIDYVLEYPFDRAFAAWPPEEFCALLFEVYRARVLVVGEDLHFGHNRAGDAVFLMHESHRYNAQVAVLAHRAENGQKIGTSAIRKLILAGELHETEKRLGFSFFMQGEVRHGKQLGRTLGFPTINLRPGADKLLPPDGVYATSTHVDGQVFRSVTNIGVKPTVNSETEERGVESFLLDFDGDLYGRELRTDFHKYIRQEKRFDNIDALREQIARDIRFV